jgi:hypothetical protein
MSEREKFEKWAKRMGYADEFDVPLMKHAAWEGWQAALSTRKAYGWGVLDKNGNVSCSAFRDMDAVTEVVKRWNADELDVDAPHRIIPLFYEDQS